MTGEPGNPVRPIQADPLVGPACETDAFGAPGPHAPQMGRLHLCSRDRE